MNINSIAWTNQPRRTGRYRSLDFIKVGTAISVVFLVVIMGMITLFYSI